MMLYLYGLIETRSLPKLMGIRGAPIAIRRVRRLAAVVSKADTTDLAPSEEMLWEHELVLEALMADGPVLPVRFGVLIDEVDLRRELRSRYEEFETALAAVRGKVEVGVRVFERPVTSANEPSAAGTSGKHYLLEKLAQHREAARLATSVRTSLAPLAVAERSNQFPPRGTVFAGSYLLDAAQLEPFRAKAAELRRTENIVCTGPWPPYSFVDLATR